MVAENFSKYIEQLCREHTLLNHSEENVHFINLNDDKFNTSTAQNAKYPLVYFELSGYKFSGADDDLKKERPCHIEILLHVSDTANYQEVEKALSDADLILNDIFAKMMRDKRKRNPRFLTALSLDGVEVLPIENKANALYGVMAEIKMPETFCTINTNNHFKE